MPTFCSLDHAITLTGASPASGISSASTREVIVYAPPAVKMARSARRRREPVGSRASVMFLARNNLGTRSPASIVVPAARVITESSWTRADDPPSVPASTLTGTRTEIEANSMLSRPFPVLKRVVFTFEALVGLVKFARIRKLEPSPTSNVTPVSEVEPKPFDQRTSPEPSSASINAVIPALRTPFSSVFSSAGSPASPIPATWIVVPRARYMPRTPSCWLVPAPSFAESVAPEPFSKIL